jgi:hypothetical protein
MDADAEESNESNEKHETQSKTSKILVAGSLRRMKTK